MSTFFILLALDLLGLAGIWLYAKYRLNKALGLESLMEDIHKEVHALTIDLNETADRNISLVEDRMRALRSLLDEADRRIGIMHREVENKAQEREVYTKLGRPRQAPEPLPGPAPRGGSQLEGSARAMRPEAQPADLPLEASDEEARQEAPIRLDLGRKTVEVTPAKESVIPPKSLREEAIELYNRGFSADIIAARLGATVAEIDLLVSLEEGRRESEGR